MKICRQELLKIAQSGHTASPSRKKSAFVVKAAKNVSEAIFVEAV